MFGVVSTLHASRREYHFLILIIETQGDRSIVVGTNDARDWLVEIDLIVVIIVVVVAFDDDWRARRGSIKAF